MPQFSGFFALAKAQSLCPDTPFIFVSGTHSKEAADETRKRATIDCVFTTSLAELPATFDRAIKEAEERKKRKAQESAIARLSRMYADQARELEQAQRSTRHPAQAEPLSQGRRDAGRSLLGHRCFGPQLFQGTNGKLYLVHPPGKHLESVATWGDKSLTGRCSRSRIAGTAPGATPPGTGPADRAAVRARHGGFEFAQPYLCVPLFAEGETLGLLHLRRTKRNRLLRSSLLESGDGGGASAAAPASRPPRKAERTDTAAPNSNPP